MDDMDRKFKDPESRNKLKNLKTDAQKQIERNKIIMKDFINKYHLDLQFSDHSCESPKEALTQTRTPTSSCKAAKSTTNNWAQTSLQSQANSDNEETLKKSKQLIDTKKTCIQNPC